MQMKYDTAVVGGGLSGMIAALELARAGESVVLYEAEPELGGFAKSHGTNQEFDEHSWRSFGDFYTNLQNVAALLGIQWPDARVDLTLFPPVPFRPTAGDLKMVWRLLQGMATPNLKPLQQQSWYALNRRDVSPWGMATLGRFNKSGSDYRDIPYSTIVRVVEMILPFRAAFRISPVPIQQYLIQPLQRKLEELGVTIRLNTSVQTLSPSSLDAHAVVAAIPPSAYAKLDASELYPNVATRMARLHGQTRHQEISFRIFFKERLTYPERICFDLHQSPWGLLIMPADLYHGWTSASVWSGTITFMRHPDQNGKTPLECTTEELKASVLAQIGECEALHAWFAQVGIDTRSALADIRDFNVWRKWQDGPPPSFALQSAEVMSVNSFKETSSRFMAGTRIGRHVFLAGAHAGTGCDMWLMESAAEAGKRAAVALLESKRKDIATVFLDKHERHPIVFTVVTAGLVLGVVGLLFAR